MIFRLVLTEATKALLKRLVSNQASAPSDDSREGAATSLGSGPAVSRHTERTDVPLRRVDILIAEFSNENRSLVNRTLLVIVVPAIAWGLLAFLWWLPFPAVLRVVPGLNWASLGVVVVALAYLPLSWKISSVLAVFGAIGVALARAYELYGQVPLWQMALTVLFCATLLRFIGARFERKRASPARAVRNAALAPGWLASRFLAMWGLRP